MSDTQAVTLGRRWFSAVVRWTLRGVAGLLVLVIVLSLAGAVFQHFAGKADAVRFRPKGQMIAVEGHQFHILCKGQGTPAVILEPGLGLPSLVWAWVQAEVAGSSRVCIYDRAGYGWSDATDAPVDAETVSRQLHALLEGANIPGPYVLVGHSIGGAYMRVFAAKYPEAAAALILVDSTSTVGLDWSTLRPPRLRNAAMEYFTAVGYFRLVLALGFFESWQELPPEEGAAVRAFLSSPKRLEAALKERSSLERTLRQLSGLGDLGSLPVTVIYSEQFAVVPIVENQRRAWLNSSTNSRSILVRGANHISILTKQEHAREVAGAIASALAGLRH